VDLNTLLLTLAAFVTAIISATVGMAGGVILLSILLFFFAPAVAIPLHAANQYVSNARRVWLLKKSVKRDFFYSFTLGALLGNALSAHLIKTTLSLDFVPILIAVMIFYTLFKPKRLPSFRPQRVGFFFVGLLLGFIGMFIGATGLILAAFFVRDDLDKTEVMATMGAMQSLSHGLKVVAFWWVGFDYLPWIIPLTGMGLGAYVGTTYGVRLLERMPEELFRKLYQGVLFFSALYLVVKWVSSFF
jgi:uncharacterized protein